VTRSGPATAVQVPFLDLRPVHAGLREAILAELGEVLDDAAFVNGPQVAAFEREFADYTGTAHCVGLASGLDALRLALAALELEPGDEVIVPASTFVATAEAVTQAGGRLRLADVREDDYGLDPEAAAAAVSSRTRALVPVHLYGQMADVQALGALARRNGLALVEDAAQAHGAARDGLRAGQAGVAAGFSFYPGKNLGAMGDAGALTTGDAALAERVRALREHGQRRKYVHEWEGWTARLDTFQAVVLRHKLARLEGWNAERSAAARAYAAGLAGVGDLRLPAVPAGSLPVWHLYVVRTAEPERLAASLRERGIGTGRHYPVPVHLAPAYARLGHREGAFPVSEALARECLSLPIFPGLTEEQVSAVLDAVRAFFDRGR
jgi:dTDP-4-amino-4,6-dideoxygalactose transaminase